MNLTNTTTPGGSGPGRNGSGVIHTLLSSRNGTSPFDTV